MCYTVTLIYCDSDSYFVFCKTVKQNDLMKKYKLPDKNTHNNVEIAFRI